MATRPKMKACPYCDDDVNLYVFTYEDGSRHVECVKCDYLGPACTSILWAIKHHNAEREQRRAEHLKCVETHTQPDIEALGKEG